jgi:hypothetical protein
VECGGGDSGESGGARKPPAEGLIDAVLQLALAVRQLGLTAAAADVHALEPAEPRAAAPRRSGYGAQTKWVGDGDGELLRHTF